MRALSVVASLAVTACFIEPSRPHHGTDGGGGGGGDAQLPPGVNIAFVTEATYVPLLLDVNPLASADQFCNMAASAANLSGHYVAWISAVNGDAKDRLANIPGWVRVDGKPVAQDVAQLLVNLWYPIRLDERGQDHHHEGAFSGTTMLGVYAASASCTNYSSSSSSDRMAFGYVDEGIAWGMGYTTDCTVAQHLYCFGTSGTVPVTAPRAPSGAKLAFVDGPGFMPSAGLVNGADVHCSTERSGARAWLATGTATADSRFTGGGPWYRPDGVAIGALAALDAPIDERIGGAPAYTSMFLGAPDQESTGGNTCQDWTTSSSSFMGDLGFADASYAVGGYGNTTCGPNPTPIICLE